MDSGELTFTQFLVAIVLPFSLGFIVGFSRESKLGYDTNRCCQVGLSTGLKYFVNAMFLSLPIAIIYAIFLAVSL